jgi:hypothetical protein
MPSTAGIHWLRENASDRTPFRVLIVDTETRPRSPDEPDIHVLRIWCARLVRRQGIDPELPRTEDYRGHTAAELAQLVDKLVKRDRTLWLMTHNLSFDLAVTALPVALADIGWTLTEGALTSDSPWCRMKRKDKRLTIADTWSWMPSSVEAIGDLMGVPKLPLPDYDADDAEWWDRCERDVDITARGITELMDWWTENKLGVWSVTGPACGWSTYRHQRPAPAVLIDPDPVARDYEARAVTGGRRDVRRTGQLPHGLYADLDLSTAHLTVMGNLPLPMRRERPFDRLELDDVALRSRVLDVLAECELDVKVPRYPWQSGAGVFYPVGRFRTVLAGPEIREAIARGELVSIGRGYRYTTGHHMMPWAVWLARLLDPDQSEAPAVARLLAKHWSRCVPGKWAGHTSEVVDRRPDIRPGWAVEHGAIMPGMRSADFLTFGGELWTIARDEWADDAFPAILAWIQSHTRVAVGRLLDRLGSSWVSVNTDGALIDVLHLLASTGLSADKVEHHQSAALVALDAWCRSLGAELAPFGVRIKGAWNDATVYGPQHLVLGSERRLAGIPRRAVELAAGRFTFTAWPKLHVQIVPDRGPSYQTEQRTVQLAHIPPMGWLLDSGRVEPARTDLDGATTWIDAPDLYRPADAPTLADRDRQHPQLRRLLPEPDPVSLGL